MGVAPPAPPPAPGAEPLHLFVGAGQSQAKGTSAASDVTSGVQVPAGQGLEFVASSSSLVAMAEPMQWNSDTGRAGPWSAFCVRYFALTGHVPVILNAGWSGASQYAFAGQAPDNTFDSSGSSNRYTTMVANIGKALTKLATRPEGYAFRGFLWDQGGQEGIQIDAGNAAVTKALYKAALQNMIAALRTRYGANFPFFITRLGQPLAGDTTGFAQIRAAQDEVDTADADTRISYAGATTFPGLGLQWDQYHYKKAGYDIVGSAVADSVVAAIGAG